MQQLKKHQHYVWKEYLKPWCLENKIYAYFKPSRKTILSTLDGVGQERFHYSLHEYSIEEELILEEIVKKFTLPEVADINLDFYAAVTSYSKIKRALSNKNVPDNIQKELTKQLNFLQKNTIEDIHMRVESLGKNLIIANSINDLEILFNGENRFVSFAFISMQYHRTKKMRLAMHGLVKDIKYLNEKYSDLLAIVFAHNLAWALAFYQKCNIVLLKNETCTSLITADQPAINTKLHIKNERGFVGEFELYYPLSPKHALLVQVKEKNEDNSIATRQMLIEEVIKYNQQIFDLSETFAFGMRDCIFPTEQ